MAEPSSASSSPWRRTIAFAPAALPLLGLVLYGSTGHDDSHLTYWSAHALARFGEIVNYNGERPYLQCLGGRRPANGHRWSVLRVVDQSVHARLGVVGAHPAPPTARSSGVWRAAELQHARGPVHPRCRLRPCSWPRRNRWAATMSRILAWVVFSAVIGALGYGIAHWRNPWKAAGQPPVLRSPVRALPSAASSAQALYIPGCVDKGGCV